MSTSNPTHSRCTRLWLVALAFAGLLAMHGLGTHGAHAAGPPPDLATLSAPGADDGHGAGHADVGTVGPHAQDGPTSYAGGLAALCLALLAVGLAWLVAHTRPGRGWRLPPGTLMALAAVPAPVTARAHAPPRRSELSIWRC